MNEPVVEIVLGRFRKSIKWFEHKTADDKMGNKGDYNCAGRLRPNAFHPWHGFRCQISNEDREVAHSRSNRTATKPSQAYQPRHKRPM